MAIIRLTIDDVEIEIEQGKTILEAAQSAGIYIPALCAHPDLPSAPGTKGDKSIYLGSQSYESSDGNTEYQGCRLCIVEIEGMDGFQTSCDLAAAEGMVIHSNTTQVQEQRREYLKAILAKHPHACMTCNQKEGCSPFESCPNSLPPLERCCSKLGFCELQSIAEYIGLKEDIPPYRYRDLPVKKDEPLFTQDYNLCIGCTRCVRICKEVRGIGALGFINKDGEILVGTIAPTLKESGCKFCGACVEVCPTGALLDLNIKRAEREAALVPCTSACPATIDAPRYIRLISERKFDEALAVIREKVPFPGTLGRVCFHPCESVCRRGQLNDPIAICTLKRFATDQITNQPQAATKVNSSGKKVAIVGAGPAGLTAAYYLAKLGHSAIVFEALSEPGGMMRVGIPRYRLPAQILNSEIDNIKNLGVEIKTDSKVDSLDILWNDGFNAIFVAMGAHKGIKMDIEGEEVQGVIEGITLLREVNQGEEVQLGNSVAVVGGGNAAIDAARTALRLNAKEVTIVYRRSREEMPANPVEIEGAIEEGVKIQFLTAPKKISSTNGNLVMECLRMELGEPDASGRRRPVPIEGSEFNLESDTIITAIGQMPDIPDDFELPIIVGGRVKVDSETLATNTKGVFAGGDIVSGPASVIEAIATGRKAAVSIDKYLGGSGEIDEILTEETVANPYFGRDEGFADRQRASSAYLSLEQRRGSYSEVEVGFDQQTAVSEAGRCLKCDLRLNISAVMMPPDDWLEFSVSNIEAAPEVDGVFRLFDANKEVIYIGSGSNIREELQELDPDDEWMQKIKYLHYEETLMYTMRESELIQQFLQEHGRMPEGNEDLF